MANATRPLTYLLTRLVAGRLRAMKKHPSQIIFITIVVALFATILILSSGDTDRKIGWVDEPTRGAIITVICLVFSYLSVRTGLKNGSTFYRLADVNLVFPSPVSQRNVLLYGFARQLGIGVLVLVWLGLQTINLQGLFAITGNGFIPFAAGAFLLTCYMPVVSMLIYGSVLRNPSRRVWLKRGLSGAVTSVAVLAIIAVVLTADPTRAFYIVFDHQIIPYIPVIGWIRTLMTAAYLGWSVYTWVSLSLSAVGLLLLVWYMLRSDLDFYEDVLLVTEKKETAIRQKKKGQSPFHTHTGKVRKIKSFYRGYGASALFYRQLLEYRKTGYFLFGKSTLLVAPIALVASYLLRNEPMGIYYLLYISLYVLFFLSLAGKWDQELTKPYIFLIPARPLVKILYATAAVHVKHLIEGLILFFLAGWYFDVPLISRFLFAFCYVGFGGLYLYTGILFHRWIGRLSDTILMRVVVFILILTVASPAITLLIYSGIRFADSPYMQWLFLAGVALYSVIIAFLSMISGRRLFTNMDHTAV
jgi:hypothetical protein